MVAFLFSENSANKPLKYVPSTKSVASTGLADARRLAGRWAALPSIYHAE